MALVQSNLKRLLAYCAIAQVGYVFLGFGVGTGLGLAAGLFHMLNHAIYKSCLFLARESLKKRRARSTLTNWADLRLACRSLSRPAWWPRWRLPEFHLSTDSPRSG